MQKRQSSSHKAPDQFYVRKDEDWAAMNSECRETRLCREDIDSIAAPFLWVETDHVQRGQSGMAPSQQSGVAHVFAEKTGEAVTDYSMLRGMQ